MSEMNLSAVDLIPFQTKAITRNGSKLVFTGFDGDGDFPYNFTIVHLAPMTDTNRLITFKQGAPHAVTIFGRDSSGTNVQDRDMDVVKIVAPWQPRARDIVTVRGLMVRDQSYAGVSYLRGQMNSNTEWEVEGPLADPGFFKVKNNDHGGNWIVTKNNMRLVRRPPRS